MMIGCLTEVLKENPLIIKSQSLINQMSAIERNRGGSISSDTFSDLFMASCFCAYVRKMKASEIMPLIMLGNDVVDAARTETFTSFINLNTDVADTKDVFNREHENVFNESQIEQLIILEEERRKDKQQNYENIDAFFSPFS